MLKSRHAEERLHSKNSPQIHTLNRLSQFYHCAHASFAGSFIAVLTGWLHLDRMLLVLNYSFFGSYIFGYFHPDDDQPHDRIDRGSE